MAYIACRYLLLSHFDVSRKVARCHSKLTTTNTESWRLPLLQHPDSRRSNYCCSNRATFESYVVFELAVQEGSNSHVVQFTCVMGEETKFYLHILPFISTVRLFCHTSIQLSCGGVGPCPPDTPAESFQGQVSLLGRP